MANVLSKEDNDNAKYNKGHRKRIVDKLISCGADSLQEYQILEMLLFLVFRRCDTRQIAKQLFEKFGSISKILNAEKEKLLEVHGIGESTYQAFQIVLSVLKILLKDNFMKKSVLDCFDDVIKYCKLNMKHLIKEELRVIFLNVKNEVIDDKVIQEGTLNKINLYPREIVKMCIDKGARNIIIIHNHPSGDPTPSVEDVYNTTKIKEACGVFNIGIHDHIIIGDSRHVSFRQLKIL